MQCTLPLSRWWIIHTSQPAYLISPTRNVPHLTSYIQQYFVRIRSFCNGRASVGPIHTYSTCSVFRTQVSTGDMTRLRVKPPDIHRGLFRDRPSRQDKAVSTPRSSPSDMSACVLIIRSTVHPEVGSASGLVYGSVPG